MKILVLGKNGQLGMSIKRVLTNDSKSHNYTFASRADLDLVNPLSVSKYFNNFHFDVIINCTAYTQVDKAEEQMVLANQVNHIGVKQLAEIAFKKNIKLIHISTDQVFDGRKQNPYEEDDKTKPLNNYGKTKRAGEIALLKALPYNGIIIRTSWLYSEFRDNFVKTIIKLGNSKPQLNIVSDQFGNPTYCADLAQVIIYIIEKNIFQEFNNETQIYHYSNEGIVNWYGFTKKIFELEEINCVLSPIKSIDYHRNAEIPKNSSLDKRKILNTLDLEIPEWDESIKHCLESLKSFNETS